VTLPDPAQKLLGALVELGGDGTPGQAGALAQLPPRTVTRAVEALRRAGLVEGGKAQLHLTPAGWAARPGAEPAVSAGPVLDQALELWADLGLYPHRAFLELLCSAVVGRARLADVRPEGHLGFMALGDTGTGKSALAALACAVFGLPPVRHTLTLPSQTAGEVLGRREPAVGGQRWVPSPVAALPFVLFDEFDKADDPVRKAVWPYFQGGVEVLAEGELQRLQPTPMLAANPPQRGDRHGQLRGEYRRRSVLLDTGYAEDRGGDIERALTAYYARPPLQIQLAGLPQPANGLPAPARQVLAMLERALTPKGRKHRPPLRALEVAVLGRAALAGGGSEQALVLAAYSVGVAYLQVTEQLGDEVAAGWQLDFDALRTYFGVGVGADELEAVVVASRRAREQAQGRKAQLRVAGEVEDLGLVGDRNALAEQLRLAARDLDGRRIPHRTDKPAAVGLQAQLKALRTDVAACRSRSRLEELRTLAAGPLQRAADLRRRIDLEQAQRKNDLSRQVADDAAAKHQAKVIATNHRASVAAEKRQAKDTLRQLRTDVKRGEALWQRQTTRSGEKPWEVLQASTLLRFEATPRPQPGQPRGLGSIRSALAASAGCWVSTLDPELSWPGSYQHCPGLAQWGESTRAVLWPHLARQHQEEDQLVADYGLPSRDRPWLYQPQPPRTIAAPRRALPPGRGM